VASIKRELGGRWAFGVVIWQCVLARVMALIVRLIGLALGLG
jgi:ferrous iron transport protein B